VKSILVVEDNIELSEILARHLQRLPFEVEILHDGQDLMARLRGKAPPPDAVILDLMIPVPSGYEILNPLKVFWPGAKIFIFSSYHQARQSIPAKMIEGFFLKTDGIDKLLGAVREKLSA
jgi:DNA-binding response OmpR family regulator